MAYIKTNKFKKIDDINKKVVSFDLLDMAIQKSNNSTQVTPIPPTPGWEKNIDSVMIEAPGYWWIHSKIDKRWCFEGTGIVGGLGMCREAKAKFFDAKKKFGNPPWDIVFRFELRDLKKFKVADHLLNK